MNYTVYDKATGQILHTINGVGSLADLNINGQSYVEGSYSSRAFYVDNGQVITKPLQPGEAYKWSYDTKSWEIDTEIASASMRVRRNILLQAIDRINPIWYASLTAEQQIELQTYRQQLLDVPQQEGFPEVIAWPTKPDWL